jgi:26S proteasome regulatory subunit N7
MAPYYKIVTSTPALPLDSALLEEMETKNKEQLVKLDERLAEAEKTEGESEISDALRAKADFYTRIGDRVPAASVRDPECHSNNLPGT